MSSSSLHEDAARKGLARLLSKPHGGELLHIAEQSILAGKWKRDFLDAVGYGGEFTQAREQLLATAWVHNKIMTGEVLTIKVRADDEPRADRQREANNAALRHLAEPFRAAVDMSQHCAASDGGLSWAEPVMGSQECWPDDDHNQEQWVYVPPFEVPLEIGSTMPSRTVLHINEDRGVARWPYGTDWITIFVAPDGVTAGFTETVVRPTADLR